MCCRDAIVPEDWSRDVAVGRSNLPIRTAQAGRNLTK
jgi:hypothetical protein